MGQNRTRTRRGRQAKLQQGGVDHRGVDYHNLDNPFPPVPAFSADRAQAIHENALRVLQELGIKVLLSEARDLYRQGGALVDDETQMVHIGREMVDQALSTAPKSISLKAGSPKRDLVLELGKLVIQPGAGAPHASDLIRGRRPGSIDDFRAFTRLTDHFDVLHMVPPVVEAQDVAPHLRHYAMTEAELTLTDKLPFVYSRGTSQVMDCFEMVRQFRGLSEQAFLADSHCYTIINTNSPRQLDVPMAQGLIDFARHQQVSIVTPFCLMGAMAPVSVAGALTLNHAEALAAITLTQLVNPGAPVCYGAFASNVDMKSGAPAFGTPEQVKANLGAGQLARLIGLPWRSAAGCAANINDAQAAHETQMSAWSVMLSGATVMIHGAGWIEGGLTVSFEKFITDTEMLQIFAELCTQTPSDEADLAFEALAEVPPGGHFFGASHTMERYQSAFYEPMNFDWSNFGTWTERGSKDASQRACEHWQSILAAPPTFQPPAEKVEQLQAFIAHRTEAGGVAPES